MKRFLVLLTIVGFAGASQGVWAATKKLKTDDISNMIIEGENRLNVSVEPPVTEWKPDVYRECEPAMRDNAVTARLTPPAIQNPPVILPGELRSEKTAEPWNRRVLQAPILTMIPKTSTTNVKMEWVFLVKDSGGRSFFERKGRGKVPERIEWNGFGSNGHPLAVGYDYSYSLSLIDEAGNPQRFNGNPFRVDAFRYEKSGDTVAFAADLLFASPSSASLSKDGLARMAEIRDGLRMRYGTSVRIVDYDDDGKFGLSRSNAIRDYLVRSLDYPPEKIATASMPKAKGDGYRHVDIIVK